MVHQSEMNRGAIWLPRFHAEIPVSLYINGKQVPPIETDGEIIGISSSCIQIRSESKIPIPSRGIIRFSLGADRELLALNVDFVQRVEITKSSWLWKMQPKYEMSVALQDNPSDIEKKYKHFINHLIFTGRSDVTTETSLDSEFA